MTAILDWVELKVTVPDEETFEAYDYGYGMISGHPVPSPINPEKIEITVRYTKEQLFNARCQRDRFWSGLHPAFLVWPDGTPVRDWIES